MAARHPLRILLAEDNVVNQKVALRLLGQMGYRADVAANGLEAIDAVARQTYDVVLMDVQMPELDGFEASREINRRWPGDRRPRIVAMTANAMQGDRELCEAAGMDDYVAKPIRVEELVGALERCRRRERRRGRAGPAASGGSGSRGRTRRLRRPGPEGTGASVDRGVVDALAASMGARLRRRADRHVRRRRRRAARHACAALTPPGTSTRSAAPRTRSSRPARRSARGRLGAMARELETMARAGSLDGAGPRVEQFAAEYETAARALGEIRRGLSA